MASIRQFTLFPEVTVGKKHRIALAIGNDRRSEKRQDIRAVRIPGDGPEPLRLALGAEHAIRAV